MFWKVRLVLVGFSSLLIIPITVSNANASSSFFNMLANDYHHTVDLTVGYRSGDYLWNIAGDFSGGDTPNILSELTYSKIQVLEASLDWELERTSGSKRGLVLAAKISGGMIQDGSAQDSDYEENDRLGEFSRSISSTKGSHTLTTEGHVGWALYTQSNWRIVPSFGLAYNGQSFVKTNGEQTVSTTAKSLALGPFENLNSSYNASWYGAYLGLSLGRIGKRHSFQFSTKQHLVKYYAHANWNLRQDFRHPKSFEHWSDGTGSVIRIKYAYRLTQTLALALHHAQENWRSGIGVDTVYFADGDAASTQFNHASWKAKSASLGIDWRF